MRRRPATLPLALAAVLALGACGPEVDEDVIGTGGPTTDALAVPASPPPGECEPVPLSDSNVYAVGTAGTVTLTREGDRLTVGSAQPAGGWDARVELREGEGVEVRFQRAEGDAVTGEAARYTFTATLQDDRTAIEVCAED